MWQGSRTDPQTEAEGGQSIAPQNVDSAQGMLTPEAGLVPGVRNTSPSRQIIQSSFTDLRQKIEARRSLGGGVSSSVPNQPSPQGGGVSSSGTNQPRLQGEQLGFNLQGKPKSNRRSRGRRQRGRRRKKQNNEQTTQSQDQRVTSIGTNQVRPQNVVVTKLGLAATTTGVLKTFQNPLMKSTQQQSVDQIQEMPRLSEFVTISTQEQSGNQIQDSPRAAPKGLGMFRNPYMKESNPTPAKQARQGGQVKSSLQNDLRNKINHKVTNANPPRYVTTDGQMMRGQHQMSRGNAKTSRASNPYRANADVSRTRDFPIRQERDQSRSLHEKPAEAIKRKIAEIQSRWDNTMHNDSILNTQNTIKPQMNTEQTNHLKPFIQKVSELKSKLVTLGNTRNTYEKPDEAMDIGYMPIINPYKSEIIQKPYEQQTNFSKLDQPPLSNIHANPILDYNSKQTEMFFKQRETLPKPNIPQPGNGGHEQRPTSSKWDKPPLSNIHANPLLDYNSKQTEMFFKQRETLPKPNIPQPDNDGHEQRPTSSKWDQSPLSNYNLYNSKQTEMFFKKNETLSKPPIPKHEKRPISSKWDQPPLPNIPPNQLHDFNYNPSEMFFRKSETLPKPQIPKPDSDRHEKVQETRKKFGQLAEDSYEQKTDNFEMRSHEASQKPFKQHDELQYYFNKDSNASLKEDSKVDYDFEQKAADERLQYLKSKLKDDPYKKPIDQNKAEAQGSNSRQSNHTSNDEIIWLTDCSKDAYKKPFEEKQALAQRSGSQYNNPPSYDELNWLTVQSKDPFRKSVEEKEQTQKSTSQFKNSSSNDEPIWLADCSKDAYKKPDEEKQSLAQRSGSQYNNPPSYDELNWFKDQSQDPYRKSVSEKEQTQKSLPPLSNNKLVRFSDQSKDAYREHNEDKYCNFDEEKPTSKKLIEPIPSGVNDCQPDDDNIESFWSAFGKTMTKLDDQTKPSKEYNSENQITSTQSSHLMLPKPVKSTNQIINPFAKEQVHRYEEHPFEEPLFVKQTSTTKTNLFMKPKPVESYQMQSTQNKAQSCEEPMFNMPPYSSVKQMSTHANTPTLTNPVKVSNDNQSPYAKQVLKSYEKPIFSARHYEHMPITQMIENQALMPTENQEQSFHEKPLFDTYSRVFSNPKKEEESRMQSAHETKANVPKRFINPMVRLSELDVEEKEPYDEDVSLKRTLAYRQAGNLEGTGLQVQHPNLPTKQSWEEPQNYIPVPSYQTSQGQAFQKPLTASKFQSDQSQVYQNPEMATSSYHFAPSQSFQNPAMTRSQPPIRGQAFQNPTMASSHQTNIGQAFQDPTMASSYNSDQGRAYQNSAIASSGQITPSHSLMNPLIAGSRHQSSSSRAFQNPSPPQSSQAQQFQNPMMGSRTFQNEMMGGSNQSRGMNQTTRWQ